MNDTMSKQDFLMHRPMVCLPTMTNLRSTVSQGIGSNTISHHPQASP